VTPIPLRSRQRTWTSVFRDADAYQPVRPVSRRTAAPTIESANPRRDPVTRRFTGRTPRSDGHLRQLCRRPTLPKSCRPVAFYGGLRRTCSPRRRCRLLAGPLIHLTIAYALSRLAPHPRHPGDGPCLSRNAPYGNAIAYTGHRLQFTAPVTHRAYRWNLPGSHRHRGVVRRIPMADSVHHPDPSGHAESRHCMSSNAVDDLTPLTVRSGRVDEVRPLGAEHSWSRSSYGAGDAEAARPPGTSMRSRRPCCRGSGSDTPERRHGRRRLGWCTIRRQRTSLSSLSRSTWPLGDGRPGRCRWRSCP